MIRTHDVFIAYPTRVYLRASVLRLRLSIGVAEEEKTKNQLKNIRLYPRL